jgi:SAM-dependent methyltransferase
MDNCWDNASRLADRLVSGRVGFEIGGPSWIFQRRGLLPFYSVARRIDNCNFSANTVWEGCVREGPYFVFDADRAPGYQYLREAVALSGISSGFYDFVLCSHTLEHIANPLQALQEWMRILKPGGLAVLVLPHKDGTFDHRRPVTQLAHLVNDLVTEVGEDDLRHLPEILKLHDLQMDPPAGSIDQFKKRSEENFANRCLHHHVFDSRLVAAVMDYVGLQICSVEAVLPFHIIAIGQTGDPSQTTENGPFLTDNANYRKGSPFYSDRS